MNFKLIAHRGNIKGPNKDLENNPEHLNKILKSYDCEVDLRYSENRSQFYLGHDEPQYKVELEWVIKNKNKLWIHCKDFSSLNILNKNNYDLNYFWHDKDLFTLTSKGFIWTYPGQKVESKSVVVLRDNDSLPVGAYGICSDNLEFIRNID